MRKHARNKNTLILFFVLLSSVNLSGQRNLPSRTLEIIPQRYQEVKEINNLELRKGYLGDGSEWKISLYFDQNDLIRKCISEYRFPEGDGEYIYYFDTAGVAIYSMSRCLSGHDRDISVSLFRDDEGQPRYLDYLEQWGDGSDALIEHTILNGLHKPVEIRDSFSYPSNVESLIKKTMSYYDSLELDDFTPSSNGELVRFTAPKAGETAFVNRNKVPVYKKATEESLIVGYLKISDDIQIRKVTADWYQIIRPASGYEEYEEYYTGYPEIAGYIRKEFVEPIEKVTGDI